MFSSMQVHRELVIIVLILTITGIVVIFAQYGAIIRKVGFFVLLFICILKPKIVKRCINPAH